jgi:histidine triad (HIT) family protein
MSTLFTKIIHGELASYKIAEDDKFYAFLDINPLKEGHTLVIPKQEIDYFFDIWSGIRRSSAKSNSYQMAMVG